MNGEHDMLLFELTHAMKSAVVSLLGKYYEDDTILTNRDPRHPGF